MVAAFINLKTKVESEGGKSMENQPKNSMILVAADQGYTGAVMETARKAGAMVTSIGVEQLVRLG